MVLEGSINSLIIIKGIMPLDEAGPLLQSANLEPVLRFLSLQPQALRALDRRKQTTDDLLTVPHSHALAAIRIPSRSF